MSTTAITLSVNNAYCYTRKYPARIGMSPYTPSRSLSPEFAQAPALAHQAPDPSYPATTAPKRPVTRISSSTPPCTLVHAQYQAHPESRSAYSPEGRPYPQARKGIRGSIIQAGKAVVQVVVGFEVRTARVRNVPRPRFQGTWACRPAPTLRNDATRSHDQRVHCIRGSSRSVQG